LQQLGGLVEQIDRNQPLGEPPERMRKAWSGAGFPLEKLWIFNPGESRNV